MPYVAFGGSSQPGNPNQTTEPLGYGASGAGVTLTAGGSSNTLGSYTSVGTTSNAWSGFILEVTYVSNTAQRYQINIRIGGSTVILEKYFVAPATGPVRVRVPIALPTSTSIDAAVQASQASLTCAITLTGIIASSSEYPGFSTGATWLDTVATTYASSTDVPITNTWTQLVASTSAQYGALLPVVSINGTNPTVAQRIVVILGTGASSSEVEFHRFRTPIASGTPYIINANGIPIEKVIASGTRLSAKIDAGNLASGDSVRIGLWGIN